MSPHEQEAKTGTRHTEERWKEKGGRGGELYGDCSWPRWLTETPRTAKPTPHE